VFFYILGAVITFIIDLVLEVEESNGMFSSVTATPTISCDPAAARSRPHQLVDLAGRHRSWN
jgi:hypothetical protein